MPGKPSTLLIWFGKSLRPVPTTAAPAASATSGKISGTGFAIAKMTGPGAIVFTISAVTQFGAEKPRKISAPLIASASVRASVSTANSAFSGVRSVRPLRMTPFESQRMKFSLFAPAVM